MNQINITKKLKLIYVIGPRFCVYSLAYESLKLLSEKYDIVCVSEGPLIEDNAFQHEFIRFTRNPDLFSDIYTLFQLFKIFVKHSDADKVVVSTPKASFLSAFVCKVLRKKYIYLHRGAVYQNYTGARLAIFKAIDKFIINNSLKTTYISKSLQQWVAISLGKEDIEFNRKFNSSKGVDLKIFYPLLDKNNNKSKIVIGYCGRISIDKGFLDLMKVLEKYNGSDKIDILIKGKKELCIKDSLMFDEFIKIKNIEYVAWDNDVSTFFNQIDILFFPSKREGFGNVAIEAAASGVPTIAYNIPGVSDAVIEGRSGLMCEEKENIVTLLDRLVRNKKQLQELSIKSRIVAEKFFDQSKVLEDIHKDMML